MTPKAYLNQAYRLEQRIRLHQEELENLRMLAASVGSPGFEEHYNPNRPDDAPFVKTLDRRALQSESSRRCTIRKNAGSHLGEGKESE